MLDYSKINEIFGAPLNVVNRPNVPVKIQGWQIAVGIGIVALATYGAYQIYVNNLKVE
jgi:hypothetical protein